MKQFDQYAMKSQGEYHDFLLRKNRATTIKPHLDSSWHLQVRSIDAHLFSQDYEVNDVPLEGQRDVYVRMSPRETQSPNHRQHLMMNQERQSSHKMIGEGSHPHWPSQKQATL